MRGPSRTRAGFTLIELLVVIAIIAILVSLLLPAVQQVREAARKAQCQDHLHNIAIAVHSYHDTNSAFPNANCGGLANSNLSGGSMFVSILPMVEQSSAYRLYDFTKASNHVDNQAVTGQELPFYLCPSMAMRRQVPDASCGTTDGGRAAGSYAASIGSVDQSAYDPVTTNNGMIVYTNSSAGKTRMRDIVDGLSNTLLVGETAYNLPDYKFSSGACAGRSRYSFTYWANPYPGSANISTQYTFNPKDLHADDGIWDPDWWKSFRSDHPGGVQFAIGDGVVKFLSENIDANLLDALATRAGGEVVGAY